MSTAKNAHPPWIDEFTTLLAQGVRLFPSQTTSLLSPLSATVDKGGRLVQFVRLNKNSLLGTSIQTQTSQAGDGGECPVMCKLR